MQIKNKKIKKTSIIIDGSLTINNRGINKAIEVKYKNYTFKEIWKNEN